MKKIIILMCIGIILNSVGCKEKNDDKSETNSIKQNVDSNKEETSNVIEENKLTYDWDKDVRNGLLYSSEDGYIVDKEGNIIEAYKDIEVLENGALMQDGAVFDGYNSGAGGKIYCIYDEEKEEIHETPDKDSIEGTYMDYDTNETITIEKNSDGTYAYYFYDNNNTFVDMFSDQLAALEDGYLAGKYSYVIINEDKSLSVTSGVGGAWGKFVKIAEDVSDSDLAEDETIISDVKEENNVIDNVEDLEHLLEYGMYQYTTSNKEWKYTIYKSSTKGYEEYIILNEYIGDTMEIVMPDEIDGARVIGIEKISKEVKSITFSKYTAKIDDYVFYECKNLEEIILPDSVLTVGESSFAYCTNVKKIRLSSNLKIVDDFSMYNIVDSSAFNYCENLVELVIPQGCETVSGFYGCTNLEQLKLPSSVKYVGDFVNCKKLQDFDIPYGVERLGSFSGCESLTQVIMPDSINFYGGFSNCINVKKVVISKRIDSLNSFDFAGCSSLAEIYIPSSVWVVDIEAFKGCPDTMIVYGEAGSGAARALSYKYTFKIIE